MENSFQTSFIPKKPITSTVVNKEPTSLFSIISIFILVVSLVASGGLFLYKNYLTKQTEASSASLLEVRDSFEKNTIEELDLFNKRTEVSKQILNSHIVLSPMFNLLGDITIPQIQYTKFEQETNNGGFNVKIEGLASDYRAIALQSEVFSSEKGHSFKNVVFSNLMKNKEKNNNITFNLEFTVDPGLLSYENSNSLSTENSETALPAETPLSQDLENVTQ
jgi:hypothetical protein